MIEIERPGFVHFIEPDAITSWGELLGLEDEQEILEAIIHVAENGEPEPDPVTGENVWTEAYRALAKREEARVQEERIAREEGTANDPRSPELRGAFAAFAERENVLSAQRVLNSRLSLDKAVKIAPVIVEAVSIADKQRFRQTLAERVSRGD